MNNQLAGQLAKNSKAALCLTVDRWLNSLIREWLRLERREWRRQREDSELKLKEDRASKKKPQALATGGVSESSQTVRAEGLSFSRPRSCNSGQSKAKGSCSACFCQELRSPVLIGHKELYHRSQLRGIPSFPLPRLCTGKKLFKCCFLTFVTSLWV